MTSRRMRMRAKMTMRGEDDDEDVEDGKVEERQK